MVVIWRRYCDGKLDSCEVFVESLTAIGVHDTKGSSYQLPSCACVAKCSELWFKKEDACINIYIGVLPL